MMSIAGVLFLIAFLAAFFGSIALYLHMRGMEAEQEMDHKLRADPLRATEVPPKSAICAHCGGRVMAKVTQCPNCGAGLP